TAKGYYMPDSKELLPRKRGREITAHVTVGENVAPDQAKDLVIGPVIEGQDDGLAAALLSLAPGTAVQGLPPKGGGGQYYLVAAGSLMEQGKEFPPLSLMFVSAEEKALRLTAGAPGAKVLCLQLPRKAA